METIPKIIQGGMGVNISSWDLARTVSMLGGLGTVSGTAIQIVMARILQNGDPGGHLRRALSHFPFQEHVERVLQEYFVEGGIKNGASFKAVPFFTVNPPDFLISLTICANHTFVWLAKQGHKNPVSINYLEKVAMPHVYAITGAMLAGVDFITMGAGIPLHIPEMINAISKSETASYRIPVDIDGEKIKSWTTMSFNPKTFFGTELSSMKKPRFIPIVASNTLAIKFKRELSNDSIYGFVIEEWTAGGHNAPPRNKVSYGEKDKVNYSQIADLGLPFWIGGSYSSPEKSQYALSVGAKGIQAGSIFALCEESSMHTKFRNEARRLGFNKALKVKTDMRISPTGYPFKVGVIDETLSKEKVYNERARICDQGGLRCPYKKLDGTIGYRCSAEPEDIYKGQKGGNSCDTEGRGCLCNGLLATCGLGNPGEPPIITLGDDTSFLQYLMADENSSYRAEDAIKYLIDDL